MIYQLRFRLSESEVLKKVKPYFSRGAMIFYGVSLVFIFGFLVPWVLGWAQYIKWLF